MISTVTGTIHINRPPTEAEATAGYAQGPPPIADLENQQIIDRNGDRKDFSHGDGLICLAVRAGDQKIGQIYVNMQYVGPVGAHDECVEGENEILTCFSARLHSIFQSICPEHAEVGFHIHAMPCPQAKTAKIDLNSVLIAMHQAAHSNIDNSTRADATVENQVDQQNKP